MGTFWKLFLASAVIVLVNIGLLVVTPASVTYPVSSREVGWLLLNFSATMAVVYLALRSLLGPLEQLRASMEATESARGTEPVRLGGSGELQRLAASYNLMLERIEAAQDEATKAALQAQENERKRVARELHDEIGQRLTLALLQLRMAGDADGGTGLKAAEEQVRLSLDEVRGLAGRLRPGVLEELGLRSALNGLCNEVAAGSGLRVERHIEPFPELHPDQDLAVYRILQESLTNAVRHAQATTVRVAAAERPGCVAFSVTDDGVGIDQPAGTGIDGMHERAKLVDATLSIGPGPGKGTEVRLEVSTDS